MTDLAIAVGVLEPEPTPPTWRDAADGIIATIAAIVLIILAGIA